MYNASDKDTFLSLTDIHTYMLQGKSVKKEEKNMDY